MKKYFNFDLTEQQLKVFNSLKIFVQNHSEKVFILKGYAGTGKTTLMFGLIKYLQEIKKNFDLLSSTGRAAKILSDLTGHRASTIHSRIYTFSDLSDDLEDIHKKRKKNITDNKSLNLLFSLSQIDADQSKKKIIYIIDESSMISNQKDKSISFAQFGDGELLNDLINYDPNGKFIFIGDPCQLPPIKQKESPALSKEYIEQKFNFNVKEHMLTTIVRQQGVNNGIIQASLNTRRLFYNPPQIKWPKLPLGKNNNIKLLSSDFQLANEYLKEINENGTENTTIICQSNRDCKELNNFVRSRLFKDTSSIQVNDLLLITQNNQKANLVNGDLVKVLSIAPKENRCGLSFWEVQAQELSSKRIINSLLINDIPYSNSTNISEEKHKDLMIDYYLRMKEKGIKQGDRLFKDNMLKDEYLNAIKCVFGYALTCHKSQGGEWDKVFLYIKQKIYGIPRPGLFQWWYTAITRARKKLFIVDDWFIS